LNWFDLNSFFSNNWCVPNPNDHCEDALELFVIVSFFKTFVFVASVPPGKDHWEVFQILSGDESSGSDVVELRKELEIGDVDDFTTSKGCSTLLH
jgi:hypothetical protein